MDYEEIHFEQVAAVLVRLGAVRMESDEAPLGLTIDDMMIFVGPPKIQADSVAEVGAVLLLSHSDQDELAPVLTDVADLLPAGTVLEAIETSELGVTVWLIDRFGPDDFDDFRLTAKLASFRERALIARRLIDNWLFTAIVEASLGDGNESD